MKHSSLAQDSYVEKYARYEGFNDIYEALIHGNQIEELDYHVHNGLLYLLEIFVYIRMKEWMSLDKHIHLSFRDISR